MKRIICLFLTIMISMSTLILLTACDDKENDYGSFNYKTDFQYYYSSMNGSNLPITKSETGYYVFLPNRFLYYIDKESMVATPLCNKVNCLHNDRDECNAYFNYFSESKNLVQYYEESLFMVLKDEDEYGSFEGNSLYKVSLDGVTREELIHFKSGISSWLVHRGYFYYSEDKFSDNVETSVVYDSFSIYRLPLNNMNAEPVEIFNSKNYCDNIQGTYQFVAYNDYIFAPVRPLSAQDLEDLNKGKWTMSSATQYYAINTNSLEVNHISNEEGDISAPTFYDGGLLYFIKNNDSSSKFRYYTSGLDGSNPTFLREMDYGDNLFSNGEQMYMQNLGLDFDESQLIDYDEVKMLDSDFSETSLFKVPFKYSVMNIPQDSEYFIFIQQVGNSDVEVHCVDKSKLNKLNGEEVEYKTVYSSLGESITTRNSLSEIDTSVTVETKDLELKKMFENAQERLYKVSSIYDDTLSDNISGGFSVKMHWSGDGGNYTANFQILKFDSETDTSMFMKENPFSLVNDKYIAFVSVETIPVEIKDMLVSIIGNNPIAPIETKDFSGEMYSFT